MTKKIFPKTSGTLRSNHQQVFIKYTLAILVDLTVLGLFNEYWKHVIIDSFSIALLASVLLQALLKVTLIIEHRIAHFFKSKSGLGAKILRLLSTWIVLFVSKLLILEAISFSFGDHVQFVGPVHGLVSFIVVVVAILIAEQLIERIYNWLG